MTYRHPYRDLRVHVWGRLLSQTDRSQNPREGAQYIARLHPYGQCLVFFHGESQAEAEAAAIAFRDDVVAKNEAAYVKRQAALEKARAKKKETSND